MKAEPKQPTDQDALRQINLIASDDFCNDLDMRYAEGSLDGDLKTAYEKLSVIYTIAHSMDRSCVCHHVHDDWRAEILKRKESENES